MSAARLVAADLVALLDGATVGAVVVAIATWPLARWLRRRQFGKTIRADGPAHQEKAGTPAMGGLAIVALLLGAGVVALVGHRGRWTFALPYVVAVAGFGALGLVDDWQGLARKGRARPLGIGLSARHLFASQFVVAVVVAALARSVDTATSDLYRYAPTRARFLGHAVTPEALLPSVPAWLFVVVAALVIVALVNGVNLSDGLDGLAAGLAAIAFAALAVAATLFGAGEDFALEAGTAALACGACLGFLVHNRYPARVFMGNVTSMALGGALATVALSSGAWPLLPLIGVVYAAEVASDVIQVGYFKWSGGKRVFRMAPIHHHFELLGWHETVVTRRFWLVGAIGAAAALCVVWWASAGLW